MRLALMRPYAPRLIGLLLALLLAACGGGSGDGAGSTTPLPAAGEAQLAAAVFDSLGRPVQGATVRTASATAVTDAQGAASVPVATGSEQVVAIEKSGFAEQVKVVNLADGTASASLQAMLIAREAPLTIAANETGGSVTGKDGVKVTLPPNALVTAGGAAVTGPVELTLTPVDVTQLDVGAFPGLFAGIASGGTRTDILTFGTAELVPQQGGQPLQLAAGRSAEIELPLYVRKHQDGSDVQAGDKIALWSLDTATGLWQQEGEGTVVLSAGSPTGFALRATITHFSWWNVDVATGRAIVNLTVNVPGETVPADTSASVEGQVVAGSGPTFVATTVATVGVPVALQVPADSTTRLSARVELATSVCTGSVNVAPPRDATISATIDATCVEVPVPRITRPGALSATNSARDVSIAVLIDGPRADRVEVFVGDTRIADFNAAIQVQPFFTAFFDSSTFAEGTYQVTARATRDGISRDSTPVTIVVDRTPPQVSSIDPAPGSEVSRTTTFTLDFSEPVNPLPFALTDAVRLAVTPPGSSTPAQLAITATLDASGQRLTVQPQAALPLGTVSLTWGGLQDAAENAITGTVSAAFVPSRRQQLVVQSQQNADAASPIAIDSAGRLVAAFVDSSGNLNVGVHDGGAFTLFGAPADNPVNIAGTPRFDFTLDAGDRPHGALMQASGGANRIVVRRFDGGAWADLGPAFTGVAAQPMRLLIDATGRPVLALMRGLFVEVHRFDAGSNAWLPLGAPTATIGGDLDNSFDLALLPNSDPVVGLVQGIFGSNAALLKAARHDGSGWVQLGGTLDSTPDATQSIGRPDLAGGANGPWLHYVKTGGVLRLLRFDGTDWEVHDVPKPAGTNSLQNPNAIALMGDDPVIAFNDFSLGAFVTRFRSGTFEPPFAVIGRPSLLSLAIRDGQVLVGAQDFCCTLIVERLLFP